MKVNTNTTGELLKTLEKQIKEAAKAAGLSGEDRGALNNALLQAKPVDAVAVTELLKNPADLVASYKAVQAKKKERTPTALETAAQGASKKLAEVAKASGVDKTKLNAALMFNLGAQTTPTVEGALEALANPEALIATHEAAKQAAIAAKAARKVAVAAPAAEVPSMS